MCRRLVETTFSQGLALLATALPMGERFRASPSVRGVSFQEVLGSRNRQSYYVSDSAVGCFDIHVLETLKVGVLRPSGIFPGLSFPPGRDIA